MNWLKLISKLWQIKKAIDEPDVWFLPFCILCGAKNERHHDDVICTNGHILKRGVATPVYTTNTGDHRGEL